MPWSAHHIPEYRKHRKSGQAVVTLGGTDHYLGPHGTLASRIAYDRADCRVSGGWPLSRVQGRDTRADTAETAGVALAYLRAGIVPIPLRLEGSKSPAISEWKQWQSACPTPELVLQWFSRPAGIAIVCGAASHGLEVLDMDCWQLFEPWRSMIRPPLFSRLVVIETAGGGYHVLYRCSEIRPEQQAIADAATAFTLVHQHRALSSAFRALKAAEGGELSSEMLAKRPGSEARRSRFLNTSAACCFRS